MSTLHHPSHDLINQFLPITPVTALRLLEAVLLENISAVRGGKFEGPEEGVALLERRPDLVDLVDQIINSMHTKRAKLFRNHLVARDREPGVVFPNIFSDLGPLVGGLVDAGVSLLEDELGDGFDVGVSADDVGHDALDHVHHGLGALDEDGLVELI